MKKISYIFSFFLLFGCLALTAAAQKKFQIETSDKLSAETLLKDCKDFKPGSPSVFPKPEYPSEARTARIGDTVRVWVKIDENGDVSDVEKYDGRKLFQDAATNAARKTKFSPTVCDGAATQVSAVLTYNFIPLIAVSSYYAPEKIKGFSDVKNDSPFFEAIQNLTENYRLAFGYNDKKFYADAPLTRGDFAQSLRLTLDFLSERAKAAGKMPREINLFYPLNPQKLTSVAQIKDLKKNEAFNDSVKTLLLKYDIAPVNDNAEFQGAIPLTQNELLDLWTKIFGEEAVPVNFAPIADGDRLISRGEFALFLEESLQVLTYKLLPDSP
ncbi:MAG: TonB family protein [Pyrinomonadaceae bacterium]